MLDVEEVTPKDELVVDDGWAAVLDIRELELEDDKVEEL